MAFDERLARAQEREEKIQAAIGMGLACLMFAALLVMWAYPAHAEPVISFTVSPKTAFTPTILTFRIEILDADETWWCPGIRWYWPDGTKSYESSDCSPYTDTTPAERARQSWSRRVPAKQAGDFTVRIALEKGGATIKSRSVEVHLR